MTTHHPASQIRRVAPRDLISDADMRDNSLLRMDGTLTREPRGGLEMLFSDQRHHSVTLPSEARNGHAADIAFLIDHLCDHVMKDTRKELFVLDGHIRPGVLVLINDADWELEGEEACCPNAEAGAIDSAIQPCDALVAVSSLPSDVLKRNAAAGENLAWSRERHPWITFSLAHPTSQGRTANQACDRNRGRGKSKTGVVFNGGWESGGEQPPCRRTSQRRDVFRQEVSTACGSETSWFGSAFCASTTHRPSRLSTGTGRLQLGEPSVQTVMTTPPAASITKSGRKRVFLQSAAGVSDRLHLSSPALPCLEPPALLLCCAVLPAAAAASAIHVLLRPSSSTQGWDCPAARRASLTSSSSAASIHPASPPPLSLPSQWIIRPENPRPLPTTQPSPVHLLVPRSPRILPWCPSPPHLPPPPPPKPAPGKSSLLVPGFGPLAPLVRLSSSMGAIPAGWLAAVAQLDRHAASAAPPPANAPPLPKVAFVQSLTSIRTLSWPGFNAAAAAAGPGLPDEPSSILMIIPPRLHHPCFQPVGLLQVTCANALCSPSTFLSGSTSTSVLAKRALAGKRGQSMWTAQRFCVFIWFLVRAVRAVCSQRAHSHRRPRRPPSSARQTGPVFPCMAAAETRLKTGGSIHLHAPQRSGGGKARQANAPPRHFCAETEQYTLGGLVQRDFAVCH
ncbi:hypothetical protein Purlil1_9451 [Purpureocillium lilacinum]|uniref:Ubiquitin-related modifier 1 n=1 Tax=Purpureocillium lilacinum TaxID=33203 RepID=A0ABR0BQ45_PURLI|nr:hypothetical protein Purlil1_9451 [Purpureocillium lilacinum]